MQTVVIIIHLIIVLALIGVVLLQRSEGGLGLGGGGGGGVSGFMTGRGQTNALTRATAVLATVFFLTSMVLVLDGDPEPRAALDPRHGCPAGGDRSAESGSGRAGARPSRAASAHAGRSGGAGRRAAGSRRDGARPRGAGRARRAAVALTTEGRV